MTATEIRRALLEELNRGPAPTGSVYFIADGEMVKIGYAVDVMSRFCSLQSGNPRPLTIIEVVPGNTSTEMWLHGEFWEHHERGEWFRVEGSLREFINALVEDPIIRKVIKKSRKSPNGGRVPAITVFTTEATADPFEYCR